MAGNSRKHSLARRDRARIRSLSRANVETTFAELQRFTAKSIWVGRGNRYSQNTLQKISSDAKAGFIRSPRQLAQYISASSVLHCSDGWGYLGKALSSLLRGDPHRARHLAYYAELRAALALLAAEGIGIFNSRHFLINAAHSVVRLETRRKTHDVVWDCLDYWGSLPRSGDLFARVVTPYGRTLDDWFTPLGGGNVVAPQAKIWFRQWGMDLRTFADDRDARNVSSYRPDGIPSAWYLSAPDILTFVQELWGIFQPSANSTFDVIDTHILRIALESTFRGQTGSEPRADRVGFRRWASGVITYQTLSQAAAAYWTQILDRELLPNDPTIFSLSAKPPEFEGNSHLAIISRAALLLRIAAGSTAQLIQAAGLTRESVEFWWDRLGQGRGLWDGPREDGSLTDLWADIEPLLRDIEGFQEKYTRAEQTFFRVGSELGHVLASLGSCERVAIWGMTPS